MKAELIEVLFQVETMPPEFIAEKKEVTSLEQAWKEIETLVFQDQFSISKEDLEAVIESQLKVNGEALGIYQAVLNNINKIKTRELQALKFSKESIEILFCGEYFSLATNLRKLG